MYGVGGWGAAGILGTATVRFDADASGLEAGVARARNALNSFSRQMAITGSTMVGQSMLMRPLVDGFSTPLIKAAKDALAFQHELNEISSVMMDDGPNAAQRYRKSLIDLSNTMGIDLKDATETLYKALSSGIPKDNVVDFLSASAQAARAGLTNLESSSQALRTVIKAYSIDLQNASNNVDKIGDSAKGASSALDTMNRINDVLLTSMAKGGMRYADLANDIGKVAAVAAETHVNLEQLGAIMSVSSRQLNMSEVTSGLQNLMRTFTRPTAAAQKAITDLNIKLGLFGDSSIELTQEWMDKQGGFIPAIEKINTLVKGSQEEWQKLTQRQQGARLATVLLTNDARDLNDALDASKKSTGAQARMAEQMTDAYQGMKTAGKQLITILTQLGDIGFSSSSSVTKGIGTINAYLKNFSSTLESAPDMRSYFVMAAGGVGVLSVGMLGLNAILGRLLLSMALFKMQLGPALVSPAAGLKSMLGVKNGPIDIYRSVANAAKGKTGVQAAAEEMSKASAITGKTGGGSVEAMSDFERLRQMHLTKGVLKENIGAANEELRNAGNAARAQVAEELAAKKALVEEAVTKYEAIRKEYEAVIAKGARPLITKEIVEEHAAIKNAISSTSQELKAAVSEYSSLIKEFDQTVAARTAEIEEKHAARILRYQKKVMSVGEGLRTLSSEAGKVGQGGDVSGILDDVKASNKLRPSRMRVSTKEVETSLVKITGIAKDLEDQSTKTATAVEKLGSSTGLTSGELDQLVKNARNELNVLRDMEGVYARNLSGLESLGVSTERFALSIGNAEKASRLLNYAKTTAANMMSAPAKDAMVGLEEFRSKMAGMSADLELSGSTVDMLNKHMDNLKTSLQGMAAKETTAGIDSFRDTLNALFVDMKGSGNEVEYLKAALADLEETIASGAKTTKYDDSLKAIKDTLSVLEGQLHTTEQAMKRIVIAEVPDSPFVTWLYKLGDTAENVFTSVVKGVATLGLEFGRATFTFEAWMSGLKNVYEIAKSVYQTLSAFWGLEASMTSYGEAVKKVTDRLQNLSVESAKDYTVKVKVEMDETAMKNTRIATLEWQLELEEFMNHWVARSAVAVTGVLADIIAQSVNGIFQALSLGVEAFKSKMPAWAVAIFNQTVLGTEIRAITAATKTGTLGEAGDKISAVGTKFRQYSIGTAPATDGPTLQDSLNKQYGSSEEIKRKESELKRLNKEVEGQAAAYAAVSAATKGARENVLKLQDQMAAFYSDYSSGLLTTLGFNKDSWSQFTGVVADAMYTSGVATRAFYEMSQDKQKEFIGNLATIWSESKGNIEEAAPKISASIQQAFGLKQETADRITKTIISTFKGVEKPAVEAVKSTAAAVETAGAPAMQSAGAVIGDSLNKGIQDTLTSAQPGMAESVINWARETANGAKHWLSRLFNADPIINTGSGTDMGFGLNTSDFTGQLGFASGTKGALKKGTWAWVGERGPELAYLSKGSKVISSSKSMSMVGSSLPGFADGTPDNGGGSGAPSAATDDQKLVVDAGNLWKKEFNAWAAYIKSLREDMMKKYGGYDPTTGHMYISKEGLNQARTDFAYANLRAIANYYGVHVTSRNMSGLLEAAGRLFDLQMSAPINEDTYSMMGGMARPGTNPKDAEALKASGYEGSYAGNQKLAEFENTYSAELARAKEGMSAKEREEYESYKTPQAKLQYDKQLLASTGIDINSNAFSTNQQIDALTNKYGTQLQQGYNSLSPSMKMQFDASSHTDAGYLKNIKVLLGMMGIDYKKDLKKASGAYSSADNFSSGMKKDDMLQEYGPVLDILYGYLNPKQKAAFDQQFSQSESAAVSAMTTLLNELGGKALQDFVSANGDLIQVTMSRLSPEQRKWLSKMSKPADVLMALLKLTNTVMDPTKHASPLNIYGKIPPMPGPMKVTPGGFGDNAIDSFTASSTYPSLSASDVAGGSAIVGTTNGAITSFRGDPLAMSKNFKSVGAKSTFAPAVDIYKRMAEILKRSGALPSSGNPLDAGLLYNKYQPTDRNGKAIGSPEYNVTSTPKGVSKSDALALAKMQDELMRILAASLAEEKAYNKSINPNGDFKVGKADGTGNSLPPVAVKEGGTTWNISDKGKVSFKTTKGDSFSAKANLYAFIKRYEKEIIACWNKLTPEQQQSFFQSATNATTTLSSMKAMLKMFGISTSEVKAAGISKAQADGVDKAVSDILSGSKSESGALTADQTISQHTGLQSDTASVDAIARSLHQAGGESASVSKPVTSGGASSRSFSEVMGINRPVVVTPTDTGVYYNNNAGYTSPSASRNASLADSTRNESNAGTTTGGTSKGSFQKIGANGLPIPKSIPTEQVVLNQDGAVVGKPGDLSNSKFPSMGVNGRPLTKTPIEQVKGNRVETRNVPFYWLPEELRKQGGAVGSGVSDFYKWFWYLDDASRYALLVNLVGAEKADKLDFSYSPYAMATFIYRKLQKGNIFEATRYKFLASHIFDVSKKSDGTYNNPNDVKELARVKKVTYHKELTGIGLGSIDVRDAYTAPDSYVDENGNTVPVDTTSPIPPGLGSDGQPPKNPSPMKSGGGASGGTSGGSSTGGYSPMAQAILGAKTPSASTFMSDSSMFSAAVSTTNAVAPVGKANAGASVTVNLNVGVIRSDDQVRALAKEVVDNVKRADFRLRK